MKNKLTPLPLLLIIQFILFSWSATAQSKSYENIQKINLRNINAIKDGNDVKGYYMFYVSDALNKDENTYSLDIMDENFTIIKNIKFHDTKKVFVLESGFNGSDLLLAFLNADNLTLEYKIYGSDGNEKFTYLLPITKKDLSFIKGTYKVYQEETNYKGLFPVEDKGFIANTPSREEKRFTFRIDYFSSLEKKKWSYTSLTGGKKILGDYLGTFKNIVYLNVQKHTSMLDENPENYLLGLDLQNGQVLFERKTDMKYRFTPSNISVINDEKAVLSGEYFDVNANVMKDKPKGLAFWEVDTAGKVISENYNSWALELGKILNVSNDGKVDDFGYMYLHQFIQTSGGKIFAIGEGFKKSVSAWGVAAKGLGILAGSYNTISMAKLKITDMILLEFDKNYTPLHSKIIPKTSNSVSLPNSSEFIRPYFLGRIVKYNVNGFDYAYTSYDKRKDNFTVYYSDFLKEKDYRGGSFNTISYIDGKITTDQIKTKNKIVGNSTILPAKPGQVLIIDYYEKTKKLEAHFEKFN